MSDNYIKNVIEAALLAAARPVPVAELAQIFDEPRPAPKDIRAVLEQLATDYEGRGVCIRETANGFRFQVRTEFSREVSRLWPDRPRKYTRALLETLALIAYRQPITRAEIENVRGVAVNADIVKTLMERNWVRVVGHRDVPGQPELLGTTTDFLDYFSLKSIEDLPPLADIKSLTDLNPQLPLPVSGVDGEAGASEPVDSGEVPVVAVNEADTSPDAEAERLDAASDDDSDEEELSASGQSNVGLVAAPPSDES
jgi:segregation and condensation protein B